MTGDFSRSGGLQAGIEYITVSVGVVYFRIFRMKCEDFVNYSTKLILDFMVARTQELYSHNSCWSR